MNAMTINHPQQLRRQADTLRKEIGSMHEKRTRIERELPQKQRALSRLEAQLAMSSGAPILPLNGCQR